MGSAQHWPAGLYFNVSSIEREYFDMFFFSNLKSYKGAFHMNPDYSWWYGYADVLGHLSRIRDRPSGSGGGGSSSGSSLAFPA